MKIIGTANNGRSHILNNNGKRIKVPTTAQQNEVSKMVNGEPVNNDQVPIYSLPNKPQKPFEAAANNPTSFRRQKVIRRKKTPKPQTPISPENIYGVPGFVVDVLNNNRLTATKKIQNEENGTFILRKANGTAVNGNKHVYSISVKGNDKVYNYMILQDKSNKIFIEGNNKNLFNTLNELLEHYKTTPINTKANTELKEQITQGGGSRTKKAGRRSSSDGKTKKAKQNRRHRRSSATKKSGNKKLSKSRKTKKASRHSRK